MTPRAHFYAADTQSLFHLIGSADRDLVREIGVHLGGEFQHPRDDDEEDFFGSEAVDEPAEWDADEEEADVAQEAVTKLIMVGLSADLAEDEAYAVQDFLAGHAVRSEAARPIDADETLSAAGVDEDSAAADEIRRLLAEGVRLQELLDFLEWLERHDASHDCLHRVQMLAQGRMPESDEPTFTELEDDAYGARFSYLTADEAAALADELDEFASEAAGEIGPAALLLSALMHYANAETTDLIVVVED